MCERSFWHEIGVSEKSQREQRCCFHTAIKSVDVEIKSRSTQPRGAAVYKLPPELLMVPGVYPRAHSWYEKDCKIKWDVKQTKKQGLTVSIFTCAAILQY